MQDSVISFICIVRNGNRLSVKDMCWDVYGRRLAVMLDQPHQKAGHIALFMTHLTQEPEFLGHVSVVQNIVFPKCASSSLWVVSVVLGSL